MLRSFSRFALTGVALAASAACSSQDPVPVTGTQSMLIIDYEILDGGAPADGGPDPFQYALATVPVTTLHDLRTLQGQAATLAANARIGVDYTSLVNANPTTAAAVEQAVVLSSGGPVDFNYFMVHNSDGTSSVYAADADSLNMATTYYNVETAYLAFNGLDAGLPGPIPVYYAPEFSQTPGAVESITDLGVTDPPVDLLVVQPASEPNTLAPGMQPGVIAYQYAANVFQLQAFGGFGPSVVDLRDIDSSDTTWNSTMSIVRSFRDGFSDFFATVIVQDPEWVHASDGTVDATRDLAPILPHCWTAADTMMLTQPRTMYDPHPLGSALAEVLWNSEVQFPGDVTYNPSVVAAMVSFGKEVQSKANGLSLADAVESIASSIDMTAQQNFCDQAVNRLGISTSDVTTSVPTCAKYVLSPPGNPCQ